MLKDNFGLNPCPTVLKTMLDFFLLFVLLYGIIWSSGQIYPMIFSLTSDHIFGVLVRVT